MLEELLGLLLGVLDVRPPVEGGAGERDGVAEEVSRLRREHVVVDRGSSGAHPENGHFHLVTAVSLDVLIHPSKKVDQK